MRQILKLAMGRLYVSTTEEVKATNPKEEDTMDQYEHDALGDAAVLLECYRDELANKGLVEQFRAINGLEVFTAPAAEATVQILRALPVGDTEPEGLRGYTIQALAKAAMQARLSVAV